jgi:hypothetical protein
MRKVKLNEARGIAESTIPYTHAVMNVLDKHIAHFLEKIKDEEYLEWTSDIRGLIPDYSTTIELPYRVLAKYIDDDIFEDFPLAKIFIDLKINLIDEDGPGTDSPSGGNFVIGGGAWPVYKKPTTATSYRAKPEGFPISKKRRESIDRVLIGKTEFDISVYKNFDYSTENRALEMELSAVVFHEMHHLYEGYKDKSKDDSVLHAKTIETTKLPRTKTHTSKAYLSDTKLVGIPGTVKDSINNLLMLYYWSLSIEVKAITQEMYPYVLGMSVNDFFGSFQGKRVKSLMNFDYEIFYDELINSVTEYYESKGNIHYMTEKKKKEQMDAFFNQIRMRLIKTYVAKANESHEVVDEKFIKQKDLKSLIKYMSNQIEKGGQKLFRNVGRLYSLKQEVNQN